MFATLTYLPLSERYARDIIPKFRSGTELTAFDKIGIASHARQLDRE